MAIGLYEILVIVGLLAAGAAYGRYAFKGAKARKYAMAGGLGLALLVFSGAGAFGVAPFLAAAPAGGPPAAGSLFAAVWDASTSDTDRTETETISVDQLTIYYILVDVQMDGLGDVLMGAVLRNMNTGLTTNTWPGAVLSIVSIGTVIVSGLPTPVANYTADRTRFNIAYSEDSGPGTWTQIFDKFYADDVTTGSVSALSIDLPTDPAVADDVPSGGSFRLVYDVAGTTLTVVLTDSG